MQSLLARPKKLSDNESFGLLILLLLGMAFNAAGWYQVGSGMIGLSIGWRIKGSFVE